MHNSPSAKLSKIDLKVGLDARCLENHISGIERYTLNLLRGIAAAQPTFHVLVLVASRTTIPQDLQKSSSLELIEVPSRPRSLADQLILPMVINRLGLRLFHQPDSFGPLIASCRRVITIHDLIGIVCRDLLMGSARSRWSRTWKAWLKLQCRSAAAIVTVSNYSANDIARILRVPRQKIYVLENAVPHIDHDYKTAPADFLAKQGISGRILLYVGRAEPYKNLLGLIRAFRLVRNRCHEPIHLVIAGKTDSRYMQAQEESHRLGLGDSVHFIGYLTEAELFYCYKSASVFVFPSLYEGFGLPPLEAMNFGLPVVSSNRTALPEVLGQAALYVNPESPEAMADGIMRVLTDSQLSCQLSAAGRKRAQTFSVLDMGIRHLELYESLLA